MIIITWTGFDRPIFCQFVRDLVIRLPKKIFFVGAAAGDIFTSFEHAA